MQNLKKFDDVDDESPQSIDDIKPHRLYSVKKVAYLLDVDAETIRRIFLKEPGVIVIRNQQPSKRIYRLIRIPGWVVIRVLERFTLREQVGAV